MKHLYFKFTSILSNFKAIFTLVLLSSLGGVNAQTPVVGGFSNFSYLERSSPVYVAPAATITGGTSYANGYLRFEIPLSQGNEILTLTSAAIPTTSGAISVSGTSVYLGQGGGSKVRIGEIDATENGQDGNPLKVFITFERSFLNASFEDGLGGWTVQNQLYYRQNQLDGMEIPIRPGENCGFTYGKVRIATAPTGTNYLVSQTTTQYPTDGAYCIMLYNTGTVPGASGANCRESAYSIFGPTIISNAFSAYAGDKFSVDWKAVAGGDWYDVVGYLMSTGPDGIWGNADDSRVMMFAERGSVNNWTTSQITIPSDGEYKFEFVSGSYDRTGGTALGATLYVDNLQLISGVMVGVNDVVMQQIARQVTYQNSTCTPPLNQVITITAKNTAGNTGSQTASTTITGVNCPPLLTATLLNPAFVENTSAVNFFSNAAVSNVETGQSITDMSFTVSGNSDGTNEEITIDGTSFPLVDGQSGTTADNFLNYAVMVSGSTTTITLNNAAGISTGTVESIINTAKYQDISGNPSAGNRNIALTYLKDNGGTANGGSDESNLNIGSVVNVKPAAKISVFSGNNQYAEVTSGLNDFVVLVTTTDDIPVSGRALSFNLTTIPVDASGQSVTVSSTLSDTQGKASTTLTLGTKTGAYILSATSPGLTGSPVLYTATATPGATDAGTSHLTVNFTIVAAGDSVEVTVEPRDEYDNPVGPGKTVAVKIDGLASDFDGPINITDRGDGTYSASVKLTNTAANNILSATSEGISLTATYEIECNPGEAYDFVVSGVQTPHVYGDYQNIDILVRDAYHNTKMNYTGTVTFTGTDNTAQYPADYAFTTADSGTKTLTDQLLFSKSGTFNLSVTESGNTSIKGLQSGIVVDKKSLTVTADNQEKVYGQSNPALKFSYNGFVLGEDESVIETKPVASTTILQNTGTGSYIDAITLSDGLDSKYDFTYVPADFTITKAMLTVTAVAKTKIYGEDNPAMTYQYSGFVLGEDETVLDIPPSIGTSVTASSDADVYAGAIIPEGASDANYDFTYATADFTVDKASLTVTADNQQKVYGEANPALTFAFQGFVPGQDNTVLDIQPVASTDIDEASAAGLNPAVITVSGGDDNNYDFIYVAGDLDITKAMLTVTADPQEKIYGSANPELTIIYSGFANSQDESALAVKPAASATVDENTVTGVYAGTITVSGGDDANYDFTYVPAGFTITKAMLTVTAVAKTKIYGEDNPAMTYQYSGFVLGEDETVLDTPSSIGTSVTASTDAGLYPGAIIPEGASDANYDFTYVTADFTVDKASLTVTADNQQKVYGEANPALTFAFQGFVSGQDKTVLDIQPVASTDIDEASAAGLHPAAITISGGDDNNYDFVYAASDFNITRAMLTVTATPQEKIYGSANPDLTFIYSGFMNSQDESALAVKPAASATVDENTVTGVYAGTITVSGGDDANYDFTYVPADFTITKAMLTVTAVAKTKIYGEDNPAMTYQYSGFVLGEDETVLDIPPSIGTSVTVSSDADVYAGAIIPEGASDANYDFTYATADFTVDKANLTVTADNQVKVYSEAIQALTFTYGGFVLGQDESFIDILPSASVSANETTGTGDYDIIMSGGEDDNYLFEYASGVLTIIKADQFISFEAIPSGLRTTQEQPLNATSTSGLNVEFDIQTPETGEIFNHSLTVLKEGVITVVARQSGDQNWKPASDVIQTLTAMPSFDNIRSLFTPNQDGMNDYWYIPDIENYGRVKVKIYNRFGKMVYSSTSYENDWDGTWEGRELPSASYYYVIDSAKRGIITGTVNILR